MAPVEVVLGSLKSFHALARQENGSENQRTTSHSTRLAYLPATDGAVQERGAGGKERSPSAAIRWTASVATGPASGRPRTARDVADPTCRRPARSGRRRRRHPSSTRRYGAGVAFAIDGSRPPSSGYRHPGARSSLLGSPPATSQIRGFTNAQPRRVSASLHARGVDPVQRLKARPKAL